MNLFKNKSFEVMIHDFLTMVEFNPDGSLKIPNWITQAKNDEDKILMAPSGIRVVKEVIRYESPKLCNVHLTLSPNACITTFVQTISSNFKQHAETPIKLIQKTDKEFIFEIGTSFRRCSECTSLIGRFRENADGNLVLKKGNCPYEQKSFSNEDYFE